MLQYTLVPTLLIVLINVCVFIYVLRTSGKSPVGFFLLVNALALIIWSGGRTLFETMGRQSPFLLTLPHLSALLIPANFLYFALTRPRPIHPGAQHPAVLFLIFLPVVLLTMVENYSSITPLLFDYRLAVEDLAFSDRTSRAVVLYTFIYLSISIAILAVRYNTSEGPDKTLSKHLVAVVTGPLFFAAFFWVASIRGGIAAIPSPSLVLMLMAQAGLVAVIRQEEILRQRKLARTAYYLTAILVAVLLVFLLHEFYVYRGGGVVLDRTLGWMMLVASVILLLLVRLRPVEKILDHIVFERASEYRQIVEETRAELREAHERLRKAERLSVVGELSARVAHEIKNPLGPIKGYTQMMREKLEDSPDYEHRDKLLGYLDVISEEAENIDTRVGQFLDSARFAQMQVEEVDVNRLVERCSRLMELEAKSQQSLGTTHEPLRVKSRCHPRLGTIQADPSRLEEAIFNLGRNAMEELANHPRAMVTIRTAPHTMENGEDAIAIIIEDNGPGFPSDHPDVFFEPFISNKVGGTGLGLAIVKSYIQAHGGDITLANRTDARGASVTITLPRASRQNPGALLPKGNAPLPGD